MARRDRRTNRVYHRALLPSGPPPTHVAAGDLVRCIALVPGREGVYGRVGMVSLVAFRRQGGAGWRARVEFKRERRRDGFAPRVTYTLPVEAVERVDPRPPRRWHFEDGHFEEVGN